MGKRLLGIVGMLFIALPLFAQGVLQKHERKLTLPKNYVCYRVTDKIKLDGKLKEPDWLAAPSTTAFVDISGEGFAKPCYETTVKMLWDSDYLYVAAQLEEDNITAYLTRRDTIIYKDNDFEVFIDPDGDGHNYFEIETNARGVVFDLMLDKPYRNGGKYMVQWDCPGMEMAIPSKALAMNMGNLLKAGKCWRINFSRVQWLKPGKREENWVWSPTGKIDMHMPDRWGFLYFSDQLVGKGEEVFHYPYDMAVYRLLWAMFYEQKDYLAKEREYMRSVQQFHLTDADLKDLPSGADIKVEATAHTYRMSIAVPAEGVNYVLSQDGCFTREKLPVRYVKNFVWSGIQKNKGEQEYKKWFSLLKECGISGVMFGGYKEDVYRWCHESGLEAHYWHWTLNRGELLKTHPDWYAVNKKGESSADKPAYVDYYRFLCPYHQGVAEYIAESYVKDSHLPYVDGVHLDYVRFPDVILPVSLWKNYGIEQTSELPEYDYCYCDVCRKLFKEKTGKDPLELKYPMQSQSWINFRLDGITHVVDAITKAVKAQSDCTISAAVFPGPTMARQMVRQDWGNWSLDAYYPMIYNGFYYEGTEWIGRSVKESVQTVNGKAKIYAGLMFGNIKKDFEKALDEAFDNGASGVSFFAGPDEKYLHRFKAYLDKRGFKVAK